MHTMPVHHLVCLGLLLVVAAAEAVDAARLVSNGTLSFSNKTIEGAAAKAAYAALSPTCAASAVADLPNRWTLSQWSSTWAPTTTSSKQWGPDLIAYPSANASQVPAGCNASAWAWYRLMRTVNDTISLDINYCHHHAPAYDTPVEVQVWCTPTSPGQDTAGCICNAAGANRTYPWKGVDCSNLSAFLYNFAFGFYPTSSIGQQACHPTAAPGRLLSNVTVPNNVTASNFTAFNPGDLLFITESKANRSIPGAVRVSHVVMWTGLTANMAANAAGPLSMDALLNNTSASMKTTVKNCMVKRNVTGMPVYVIADSSNNGPAFRPFCGWYMTSFSHARRIIDPSPALPKNADNIALYNATSGDCMSNWALQI